MKKYKKLLVSLVVFTLLITSFILGTNFKEEETYQEEKTKDMNKNLLSYYLENDSGEYEMSSSESWPTDGYKFNETLSKCENGGELAWDDTKKVVTMFGNTSDKCFVYFDKKIPTLAEYVISQYTGTQGENSLYYHDSNLTNGAGDNSYRYAGASSSVNNYVCFGSTDTTCPTDNLYRIIGVFGDQVKLIKSTKATSALLGTDGDYYSDTAYYWNYKNNTSINNRWGSNTWSTSLLNKTNLNTNFISNIGRTWASKIAITTWKVGGNTSANIAKQIPSVAYQNEIISPVTTNSTDNATEYSAKIGLMYASDYGFAASPEAWTSTLGSYSKSTITSSNWIYLSYDFDWTISRVAGDSYTVLLVCGLGYVGTVQGDDFYASSPSGVRPVFYLESSATYSGGTGEETNPIRIN